MGFLIKSKSAAEIVQIMHPFGVGPGLRDIQFLSLTCSFLVSSFYTSIYHLLARHLTSYFHL